MPLKKISGHGISEICPLSKTNKLSKMQKLLKTLN